MTSYKTPEIYVELEAIRQEIVKLRLVLLMLIAAYVRANDIEPEWLVDDLKKLIKIYRSFTSE